jgi:hypothetical protein
MGKCEDAVPDEETMREDATRDPCGQASGESAGGRLADGLVLAMHCVPYEVDDHVEAFWSALAQSLARRQQGLMLLSTTPVRDPALQALEIPFELPAFAGRWPGLGSERWRPCEAAVDDAVRWYRCTPAVARDALHVAHELFADLLATLRPSAVLGWQALNPVTRLLREHAVRAEIPYWNAERGWVRNTLQIDMGSVHLLGEVRRSLGHERQRRAYRPSAAVLGALARRARGAADLGRYAGRPREPGPVLRARLGLPSDARVAVVFTHGEPGVNAMGAALVREVHDLSPEGLQRRFDAVCQALMARGWWVLVQEHPFNEAAGCQLRLPPHARVRRVTENVSSLLDLADVCLFTLATLQFDAVFLGKPLGLLCRSGLYRAGVPPFLGDHASVDAFIDDLLDEAAWPGRFRQLQAEVAYVYEHLLLDLEADALAAEADACAEWLSGLGRPVDAGLPARIDAFLRKWGAGAPADENGELWL